LWPSPPRDDGSTLLCAIGDTHYNDFKPARREQFITSMVRGAVPDLYIHVGDVTDIGHTLQNDAGKAYLDQLPAPWIAASGNHDVMTQSAATFAAAMGMPGKDFTHDIDHIRLISPAVEAEQTNLTLTAAQLSWMEEQFAALGGRHGYVLHHVPLKNTVLGDTSQVFASTQAHFYTHPDATVRALLAEYPDVKAWISGHTHSPKDTPGLLKVESVGGHTIACINAGSPHYIGLGETYTDPMHVLYLSCYEDRIAVRPRNVGAWAWDTINGKRMTELALS
jgi:predicted phosphodiesterase